MSDIDQMLLLTKDIREVIEASPFTSKGYKILKLIGGGNFSSAYLIENTNKDKFILKITERDREIEDYDMFDTEIRIYDYLRQKYTDRCKELGLLCIVDNFEVTHPLGVYILTIIDYFGDTDLKPLISGKKF